MVFQPEMRYSGLQFVIQTEVYSVEEEKLSWRPGPLTHGGQLHTWHLHPLSLFSSVLPAFYLASVP